MKKLFFVACSLIAYTASQMTYAITQEEFYGSEDTLFGDPRSWKSYGWSDTDKELIEKATVYLVALSKVNPGVATAGSIWFIKPSDYKSSSLYDSKKKNVDVQKMYAWYTFKKRKKLELLHKINFAILEQKITSDEFPMAEFDPAWTARYFSKKYANNNYNDTAILQQAGLIIRSFSNKAKSNVKNAAFTALEALKYDLARGNKDKTKNVLVNLLYKLRSTKKSVKNFPLGKDVGLNPSFADYSLSAWNNGKKSPAMEPSEFVDLVFQIFGTAQASDWKIESLRKIN